jgi:hypothetical protein
MKRVMAVAVFQVMVMLGWAAQNEYVRATAPTFRIPLEPRDPYDLLRGRYFVMNPKDARMVAGAPDVLLTAEAVKAFLGEESSFHGAAFVGFCPQGEVFRVCALAHRVPVDASAKATVDEERGEAPPRRAKDASPKATVDEERGEAPPRRAKDASPKATVDEERGEAPPRRAKDASAQYWSRARLYIWNESPGGTDAPKAGHGITIDLGLDRFFLPNRITLPGRENEPGWEVEVCHRPGLTPLPRRLFFKGQPVLMD